MGNLAPEYPQGTAKSCRTDSVGSKRLLTFHGKLSGSSNTVSVLLDSGASQNYLRKVTFDTLSGIVKRNLKRKGKVQIRLATGLRVQMNRLEINLHLDLNGMKGNENFLVIDMDNDYDVILGMPWFEKHKPCVDWMNKTVCSSPSKVCCEHSNCKLLVGHDSFLANLNKVQTVPSTGVGRAEVLDGKVESPTKKVVELQSVFPEGMESNKFDAGACTPSVKTGLHHSSHVFAGDARDSVLDKGKKNNMNDSFCDRGGNSITDSDTSSEHRRISKNGYDKVWDTVPCLIPDSDKTSAEVRPTSAEEAIKLPVQSYKSMLRDVKLGKITELMFMCPEEELYSSEVLQNSEVGIVPEGTKKERFQSQGWEALKGSPFYDLLWEYRDVFPDEVPCRLPSDKGIRHEIDLVPGTKYCVTRQWPLPKEQMKVIDDFFAARQAAGQVRESKSLHCSPSFCVKKATGGWRIVHAYNKLNAATIPAQTPIPRKDTIINGMVGSTIFSTIDLRDGYYQILMRSKDIPLAAVSKPNGLLWE